VNKLANELNRNFSIDKGQMAEKTCEEILNIPDHKGNAYQNHVKISPYSC
jgi:hypothetical protein